ncbi:MAG: hypothetical protein AAB439_02730 [Patescibacteria group bacterium]
MTLTDIINIITNLAQLVVPILVALALLFFLWGLATFILNAGETDKQKVGKDRMLWGLVALFFIISIGGLLVILQGTFFPDQGLHNTPSGFTANQFPTSGGAGGGGGEGSLLDGGSADRPFRFGGFACFFGNCEGETEGFRRIR